MKKWSQIAGYVLLLLSCLLWGIIFIMPWLDYSKGQIAGIITALIIAGEITFYLSIILLGKSIIIKIKSKLKFWKSPADEPDFPQQAGPK